MMREVGCGLGSCLLVGQHSVVPVSVRGGGRCTEEKYIQGCTSRCCVSA